MTFTSLALWIIGLAYMLCCLWLIIVVLLQEGKSGGLTQADTTAQSPEALTGAFGAGGAQKGLYRTTAVTATIFGVLALTLTIIGSRRDLEGGVLDLPPDQPASAVAPDVTTDQPLVPENTTPAETDTVPAE